MAHQNKKSMEMKTGKSKKPDVRFLYDMKEVIYDKEWLKTARNFPLYYMYRGVKRMNGLRYDVTRIPARMLGREFTKTKGHEHLNRYGEIYRVLKGRAIYLIQKRKGNEIKDVFAVKAKAKEFVIVPPLYGHITINPGPRELKEANWVDEKCKNVYNSFEKKHGACYYFTKEGWIKNKNYKKVPRLRFKKPLKKMPENLDFLRGQM
jgi:glucose-6-phosphate isomerase